MRGLILAALGLLLLVSAASATGSGNAVISEVTQSSTGTCIVGANLAQATVLDTNLLGCDNLVDQQMFVTADGNDLIGMSSLMGEGGEGGEGNTSGEGSATSGEIADEGEFMGMNFVQGGEMVFNATGSDNIGYQDVDLNANENCQTFGNFSQMGIQTADAIGCDNLISQDTDTYAGVIPTAEGGPIGSPNDFVMSNTQQASLLNVCTVGDANDLDQHAEQDLFDSCVTTSTLSQQALLNADVWGCDNTNDVEVGQGETDHGQSSLQTIDDSSFLGSAVAQGVSENEQVLGSDNAFAQFGNTLIDDSCFTMGTASQSISETFATAGCGNAADQDATLSNVDNSIVGGRLAQQSTIDTNL